LNTSDVAFAHVAGPASEGQLLDRQRHYPLKLLELSNHNVLTLSEGE
jgi:hypothetical protein